MVLGPSIRQCQAADDLRENSAGVIMPSGIVGMQNTIEIASEQDVPIRVL